MTPRVGDRITILPGKVRVACRRCGQHRHVNRDLIYLKSIAVAGFRGVRPKATLHLQPHTGLTPVVGRKGSGKSTFADGAELALTGDSARWADRNAVFRNDGAPARGLAVRDRHTAMSGREAVGHPDAARLHRRPHRP